VTAPAIPHVEPKKPKRRKLLFRVLWGMFAIVVAVGAFWYWSYQQALAERDALVAELRARGEPIFWNELADKLLNERSKETGADLYMKTLWTLGGELNRNGPRVPSVKLEDDLKDVRLKPSIRADVQKELALGAPAISFLEEAVKRRPGLLTTALRTEDPISILLPHIQDGRNLVRYLHWMAYDALARGDAKQAYHAAWLSFGASEQLAIEPFLIAQLVRLAMRAAACDSLVMCLEYASPPEEEFRALDKMFAAADEGFNIDEALQSERAMWLTVLEDPKQLRHFLVWGSRPGFNDFESFANRRWSEIIASPLGRPVILRTQSAFIKLNEKLSDLTDRPNVDAKERDAAFDEFEHTAALRQFGLDVNGWGLRSSNSFDQACERAHRRNIMTRLALRLRRHYDKYGRFPEKLDELCDADMPKVRLDWFRNRPIVYVPSTKGFRLEVPDELLKKADRDRKKNSPTNEMVINVELKKVEQTKKPAGK
jgi:hypothetical protein